LQAFCAFYGRFGVGAIDKTAVARMDTEFSDLIFDTYHQKYHQI
jgi:hypothetical protein